MTLSLQTISLLLLAAVASGCSVARADLTATSSRVAGVIVGLPESQIENVLLENVTITAEETGLEIRHAKGVQLKNVKVTPKKGEPLIVKDAEVAGLDPAK